MVTFYALFADMKAFLWNTTEKDDGIACLRAVEILRKEKIEKGLLFRGPTGKDQMDFVGLVY